MLNFLEKVLSNIISIFKSGTNTKKVSKINNSVVIGSNINDDKETRVSNLDDE